MGLIKYRGNNKELYFVHIPKNAGTSMIKTYPMEKYLGHVSYKMIFSLNLLKGRSNVKTFAIVRNPWDRFVSAYEYCRMKTSFWHNDLNPNPLFEIASSYSFENFVKYFYNVKDTLNIINEPLYHVNSQYLWVTDNTNTIKVDHIIRFENLEEGLSNIGLNKTLQYINKSPHKSYQLYYTKETEDMIAEMYTTDIELFKYSFF